MSITTDIAPGAAVMAHCIIFEGKEFPLSIARHKLDGSLSITRFDEEVHTTEFVNGTVSVQKKESGGYFFTQLMPCGKEELR
ncbi:MAG: hypothetical protein HDS59_05190 [Barnesiella sp.]|nr:hypothetical protein [Barnesiella sp.]